MENEEKVEASEAEETKTAGPGTPAETSAKPDLTGTVKNWLSTVGETVSGLVSQVTAHRPWAPATDVYVTAGELVVLADLPGVSSGDLEIDATPTSITVSGKRCADDAPEAKEYVQRGCDRGPFEKTIALQSEIRHGEVSAKLNKGVLELRAPLEVTKKPKVTVVAEDAD
jgi:HSP20 family molecular chaperone IbpA